MAKPGRTRKGPKIGRSTAAQVREETGASPEEMAALAEGSAGQGLRFRAQRRAAGKASIGVKRANAARK